MTKVNKGRKNERAYIKHTVKLLASMIRQQNMLRISFFFLSLFFFPPFHLNLLTRPQKQAKIGFRLSRTWFCGEIQKHLGRRVSMYVCVCVSELSSASIQKKRKMSVAYCGKVGTLSVFPKQFSIRMHVGVFVCMYVWLHKNVSVSVCCRVFRQWASRGFSLFFSSSTPSTIKHKG